MSTRTSIDERLGGEERGAVTTVRQPLWEMGRTTAELLLRKAAHRTAKRPDEVVMQPELKVRESTGPAKKVGRTRS